MKRNENKPGQATVSIGVQPTRSACNNKILLEENEL